jgi:hypothetical protein
MNAKDIYLKIKALFDDATPPPPPPAPLAPPVGTPYTLQDGTTQISIVQAGDTPAVGDVVTIAGAPAPANTYTLQDGSTLTTDATGTITAYTPAAPVTVDPAAAAKQTPAVPAPPAATPAAPAAKFESTPENIKAVIEKMTPETAGAMMASFATGSDQDRLANLELVCKALMEYNFGWQIREAQQKATADTAIEVYKQELITAQAALTSHKTVADTQEAKLKGLFELVEKLVEMPTADPKTLTGNKKDKFEKEKSKDDKFEKIAAGLKQIREDKNK